MPPSVPRNRQRASTGRRSKDTRARAVIFNFLFFCCRKYNIFHQVIFLRSRPLVCGRIRYTVSRKKCNRRRPSVFGEDRCVRGNAAKRFRVRSGHVRTSRAHIVRTTSTKVICLKVFRVTSRYPSLTG